MEQIEAVECLYITQGSLQNIKKITAEDNTLQELQAVIKQEWLETKTSWTPYWCHIIIAETNKLRIIV